MQHKEIFHYYQSFTMQACFLLALFFTDTIKSGNILIFTGMFLLIFTCSLQIWSLRQLSVPGLAAVRKDFLFQRGVMC